MVGYTPEKDEGTHAGERVVFWFWAGILIVGLSLMIAIPLLEMGS